MNHKIKVRIQNDPEYGHKVALIYRDVQYVHKATTREVLSYSGKWREKAAYSTIFEDEKFEVEEN